MKTVILRLGIVVLFFLSAHVAHAQVSVKMGYGVKFLKGEKVNDIYNYLRQKKPYLSLEYKRFNNLQGVVFGVRYKKEFFATELDLDYSFWTIQGAGPNANGKREEIKGSIANSSFGYTLEGLFGNISIGTSIHYNTISQKIKTNYKGNPKSKSNYLSQKVFMGLYVPGSKHTMLAFRPYIEIPYGNVNYYPTELEVNDRDDSLEADFEWKPSSFGIQLLFLNGG